MIAYGINDVPLKEMPLNISGFSKEPGETSARIMILLATAFSASNDSETDRIADWLKTESIWQFAGETEKMFFREHHHSDEEKGKLSFRFEGAYLLAWALKLVDIAPDPSSECDAELVGDFFAGVPPLLDDVSPIFEDPKYRAIAAIHDEYLFYKMAELYFNHIQKEDRENTSNVHESAAKERLLVLEWLLNEDDPDWDTLTDETA